MSREDFHVDDWVLTTRTCSGAIKHHVYQLWKPPFLDIDRPVIKCENWKELRDTANNDGWACACFESWIKLTPEEAKMYQLKS